MNLLAIETATETCSVALMVNGEVLQRYEHAPRQHAKLLLPWIQSLLTQAQIGFKHLDAIAFSRGPGSFTSLRIGIGVVQGLAWATDCPVIPVSSLAATAQVAAGKGIKTALVALDARMKEVFTGLFCLDGNGIMKPVDEEKVCAPEQVQMPDRQGFHAVGIGFDRYPVLRQMAVNSSGIEADIWPAAASVITLAQDWLNTNEAMPAEQAQPVYLRDNVASKPTKNLSIR